MSIAWHPKRMWSFRMSQDEKKEIGSILQSNAFNVYNMKVLEHFTTCYRLEFLVNTQSF